MVHEQKYKEVGVIRWAASLALALCAILGPSLGSAQAQDVAGLRWSIVKKPDCPPRSCWQVKVTAASTYCPHGLYLALNQWTEADLRSTSNVFLEDVTAVLPRLRSRETVIITLPRSARRAQGVSMSEINCY